MDTRSYIVQLLQTPAFYIALLGLKNAVVDTIVKAWFPGAPIQEVSSAFDNVVLVVASVITGKVISDARAAQAERAAA